MHKITDTDELAALYGTQSAASTRKVADHLTPLYLKWIMASRLCMVSTVGPEGTDCSPRGDEGPVVAPLDAKTLAMPDWRGNNRLDTLRNIVRDGRVSLMFLVPGSNTVVRANGTAFVTEDTEMRVRFEKKGKQPATVIVFRVGEVYTQCARALMRSGTWTAAHDTADLPTPGEILAEASQGDEGGAQYDANWGARAEKSMW